MDEYNPFSAGDAQVGGARPVLNSSSTAGAPKQADAEYDPFKTGDAQVTPSQSGHTEEGYNPFDKDAALSNEDLRKQFEEEYSKGTLQKVTDTAKGFARGVGGFFSPFLRESPEELGGASAQPGFGRRLLSTFTASKARALQELSDFASGIPAHQVEEAAAHPVRALIHNLGGAPLDYIANKIAPQSKEEAWQEYQQKYFRNKAVAEQPVSSIAKTLTTNPLETKVANGAEPLPVTERALATAEQLVIPEAVIGLTGKVARVADAASQAAGVAKAAEVAGQALQLGGKGLKAVGELPERAAGVATKALLGEEAGAAATKTMKGAELASIPAAVVSHGVGAAMHPLIGAGVAFKTAIKAGEAARGVGEVVEAMAKAPADSIWGRMHSVATNGDSPSWMKTLLSNRLVETAGQIGKAGADVLKGGAAGAGIGALYGSETGQTPEEIAESAGGGFGMGAGLHATKIPGLGNRTILARNAEASASLLKQHLQDGVPPEALKNVPDSAWSMAAAMEQTPGLNAKIRFVSPEQFSNLKTPDGSPLTDPGAGGVWDRSRRTVWINTDSKRGVTDTLLHEMGHPIFDNAVLRQPEIGLAVEKSLAEKGQSVDDLKRQYIESLMRNELASMPDAQTREGAVQNRIQAYDSAYPSNSWIYSEALAENYVNSLGTKEVLKLDPTVAGIMRDAVKSMFGGQENAKGFFRDYSNVVQSPELSKLSRGILKSMQEYRPGLDVLGGEESGVKLTPEMFGKRAEAPLHDLPNGEKGNDFVVATPDGVKTRAPSVIRKIIRDRVAAVRGLFDKNKVLPLGDTSPEVSYRRNNAGGEEISGKQLPKSFYDLPVYSEDTKNVARVVQKAIDNGESLGSWYHQLGSGKGEQTWAQSVKARLGAFVAKYHDYQPFGWLADKQGNLSAYVFDRQALNARLADWANRKGLISLEQWGGDQGRAMADIQTYLDNHSKGLPGATGIGPDKANTVNAILTGRNAAFEAANPLREHLKGKDRQGIVRSLRLDRIETVEPSQQKAIARPEYQKLIQNYSPEQLREEFKDSSPTVKDEKGNPKPFYHGSFNMSDLVKSGQFDISKTSGASLYGQGFYFTDSAKVAGGSVWKNKARALFGLKPTGYAMQPTDAHPMFETKKAVMGGSPGVMPVYINLKNPLIANKSYPISEIKEFISKLPTTRHKGFGFSNLLREASEAGKTDMPGHELYLAAQGESRDLRKFNLYRKPGTDPVPTPSSTDLLQSMGFDGVTYLGGLRRKGLGEHGVVVAFKPEQVISSISDQPWIKSTQNDRRAEPLHNFSPSDEMDMLFHSKSEDYNRFVSSFTGPYGGGQTGWSFELGSRIKSIEELNKLRTLRTEASNEIKTARANGDMNGAMIWASKAQAMREAYEAATDETLDGKPSTTRDFINKRFGKDFTTPMPASERTADKEATEIFHKAGIEHHSNQLFSPNLPAEDRVSKAAADTLYAVGAPLKVYHFSDAGSKLKSIDPKFMRGVHESWGDTVKRSFFFVEGSDRTQPGTGFTDRHVYSATLDGAKIYDASGDDPLGFFKNWPTANDAPIQKAGYDGVYMTANGGADKLVLMYKPTKVELAGKVEKGIEIKPKKGADVSGMQSYYARPEEPGMFSPAEEAGAEKTADPFYSQLSGVVDTKFSGKEMPAAQLSAILRNTQNGVKAEELKWTGLDDYLKGKGRVSKQEVQDYLKANQVKVKEVTLGGRADYTYDLEQQEAGDWRIKNSKTGGYVGEDSYVDRSDALDDLKQMEPSAEPTKFENYQLPGGENYREMLFQLPNKPSRIANSEYRVEPLTYDDGHTSYFAVTPNSRSHAFKTQAEAEAHLARIPRFVLRLRRFQAAQQFKSGHWDEPNVVAHTRMNDRTDSEGRPGLFLEEIQSDWHQKGRKEGYALPDFKPEELKLAYSHVVAGGLGDSYTFDLPTGERVGSFLAHSEEDARAKAFERVKTQDLGVRKSPGVPDAPFKSTWHEMVFRRMVRQAAEEGKDWLGWTTGEQQAERYDLSEQITSLSYQKNPDGTFKVTAHKGGEGIPLGEKLSADKLSDSVGKDVAEKIIAGEGKRNNFAANNQPENIWRSLSGIDLKVGGEGMEGFYDKILVDYANKFGKKFGARVMDREIGATNKNLVSGREVVPTDHGWAVIDAHGTLIKEFEGENDARAKAKAFAENPQVTTIHSLPITPEMKESVMTKGVALFSPSDVDEKKVARYGSRVSSILNTKQESGSASPGVTFSVAKGQERKNGYAVSLWPDLSKQITPEDFTKQTFSDFIKNNWALLNNKDNALGVWDDRKGDTGKIWLDVVHVTGDKALAEFGGKKYNQAGIGDLSEYAKGPEGNGFISTGGTGEAPTDMAPVSERLDALNKEHAASIEKPQIESTITPAVPKLSEKNRQRQPEEVDKLSLQHVIDSPDMKDWASKVVDHFKTLPGLKDVDATDSGAALREISNRMSQNLKFWYDKATPDERAKWGKWYDYAHTMSKEWGKDFGMNWHTVAAINAKLSPQMNWFNNVTLTRACLQTIEDNPSFTEADRKFLNEKFEKIKSAKDRKFWEDQIAAVKDGTKLSEMTDSQAGPFIRSHNELQGDLPTHDHTLEPVGGRTGWGKPFNDLADVISIYRDPSFANVHEKLGNNHKVRSFYNNHIAPDSPNWTTIDTHAMAAALMLPTGGTDTATIFGFDGVKHKASGYNGSYVVYQDAYEKAAHDLHILPRELQSIVWEKIRQNLSPERKRALQRSPEVVNDIHNLVEDKKLTPEQGRAAIVKEFQRKTVAQREAEKAVPTGGGGEPF